MALTVEDGTVVPDADSYQSVADMDAYHAGRGNTNWFSGAGVLEANVTLGSNHPAGTATLTLATDVTGGYFLKEGDSILIGASLIPYFVVDSSGAVGFSDSGTVEVTPVLQSSEVLGAAVVMHETLKEAAMRYATKSLDQRYNWYGSKTTSDQGVYRLEWPRNISSVSSQNVVGWNGAPCGQSATVGRVIASDEIPIEVKHAQAELSLAHLDSVLNEVRERGGLVLAHGVGPLFQQFSKGAPGGRTFPFIDDLVSGLASVRKGQASMSRG